MTDALVPAPSEHRTPPNSGETVGGNEGKIIKLIENGLPESPDSVSGTKRFYASDMPNENALPPEDRSYFEISAAIGHGQFPNDSTERLNNLSLMSGDRTAAPDEDGVTHLRSMLDIHRDDRGLRLTTTEVTRTNGIEKVTRSEPDTYVTDDNIGRVLAQIEEHGIQPFQQQVAAAQAP